MMNIHDEDDKMCPPNSYGINSQKFLIENISYPRNIGKLHVEEDGNDNDEEDVDNEDGNEGDDDEEDDDDGGDGVQRIGKDDYEDGDGNDSADDDFGDLQRHSKKRKLKTLLSNYEFAPRLPAPSSSSVSSAPKQSHGRRNPLLDWTERETFILLDAWGERFLKQGRKSLRSEEWHEVAEKVSQDSKIERSDTQCRNRLDTLKKKYKKEKMKYGENGNSACKWNYFRKMDELLSCPLQQAGLSSGVDSGECAFMNPNAYLNQSNGSDEMRDSSGNSESGGGGEDGWEGLQSQRSNKGGRLRGSAASFKLLANSILKFSEIYQKIENSKRQQMMELEKMRMDFHRDLELHKRCILEKAQAELEKQARR